MKSVRSLSLLLLGAALLALGAGAVFAQSAEKSVNLTGAEEATPVTTTATGKFTYTVSADKITWRLQATGTGLTAAHIHLAAKGAAGPIVANLVAGAGVATIDTTGTATAAELLGPLQGKTFADFVAALNAGTLYVNVHSQANAGGEIRGQLPAAVTAPSTGTGLAPSSGGSTDALPWVLGVVLLVVSGVTGGIAVARRRA